MAAAALVGPDAALAAPEDGVLAGVVEAVDPPSALRLRTRAGTTVVEITTDALLWREGPAQLTDFIPGDEVAAEGAWLGARFLASGVTPMFRLANGDIIERTGDLLETSAGAIRITEHTEAAETMGEDGTFYAAAPLAELQPGDRVLVLGRFEPTTGDLRAGRIGRAT